MSLPLTGVSSSSDVLAAVGSSGGFGRPSRHSSGIGAVPVFLPLTAPDKVRTTPLPRCHVRMTSRNLVLVFIDIVRLMHSTKARATATRRCFLAHAPTPEADARGAG